MDSLTGHDLTRSSDRRPLVDVPVVAAGGIGDASGCNRRPGSCAGGGSNGKVIPACERVRRPRLIARLLREKKSRTHAQTKGFTGKKDISAGSNCLLRSGNRGGGDSTYPVHRGLSATYAIRQSGGAIGPCPCGRAKRKSSACTTCRLTERCLRTFPRRRAVFNWSASRRQTHFQR